MPSRLLSNSRRQGHSSASAAVASGSRDNHVRATLPPYESPKFPMNETAKRALVDLSNNHDARQYAKHLEQSSKLVQSSVGAINDRLYERKEHLAHYASNRQGKGLEQKKAREIDTERSVEALETKVTALTSQSEKAMREIIDQRIELEDEKALLTQVHARIQEQSPPVAREAKVSRQDPGSDSEAEQEADRNPTDQDVEMEDAEEAVQYPGASELLQSTRRTRAEDYGNLSMYERYGMNNDYIAFRRTLHDARAHEDAPLAHASTWFDQNGQPTGISHDQDTQNSAEAGDEDLVIEREVLSFKCPVSLTTMVEPFKSKVCKHTFDKESIFALLKQAGAHGKCPVCNANLKKSDLVFDEVMDRKIKRAAKASQARVGNDMYDDDDEPDADPDSSMAIGGSRNIKKERRGRRVAEEVEDDD